MSANTQSLTILAQDPSVRAKGALVLAQVDVPSESLASGPIGYRVKVVDFDATANRLYSPRVYDYSPDGQIVDPYALPTAPLSAKARRAFDDKLLADPNFHAQHVYAIVMRTLARFEYALGRRTSWSFSGHQLHVAPHAFCEANAYYSAGDRALLFGYFEGKRQKTIFTCLSHDIVAHETTHALLDGLRDRYTDPSGPDQAGFHEGFSDVVALLSVFSLRSIVELGLTGGKAPIKTLNGLRLISGDHLSADSIADSILFGLGKEFGQEMDGVRRNALRRSVKLRPSVKYLKDPAYAEPHARGEIFAAVLLWTMLQLWVSRIEKLGTFGRNRYNLDMVIDEGVKVADQLLSIVIRALDYCPPVDLDFSDYVAALLTVDREVAPDDTRFNYRDVIVDTFSRYGIVVPDAETDETGCWHAFPDNEQIVYNKTNFESMLRDKEEVFRFIWENRTILGIDDRGYTEVISVRPSTRFGPDGFMLRETICEYIQIVELFASELPTVLHIERPDGMSTRQRVTAYGGGILVFDQYGRIKYHIVRRLADTLRQSRRLEYLWTTGALDQPRDDGNHFAAVHRERAQIQEGA
ncbi:MAG: hypothetical protein WB542_17515 [Polaromonas sp.]